MRALRLARPCRRPWRSRLVLGLCVAALRVASCGGARRGRRRRRPAARRRRERRGAAGAARHGGTPAARARRAAAGDAPARRARQAGGGRRRGHAGSRRGAAGSAGAPAPPARRHAPAPPAPPAPPGAAAPPAPPARPAPPGAAAPPAPRDDRRRRTRRHDRHRRHHRHARARPAPTCTVAAGRVCTRRAGAQREPVRLHLRAGGARTRAARGSLARTTTCRWSRTGSSPASSPTARTRRCGGCNWLTNSVAGSNADPRLLRVHHRLLRPRQRPARRNTNPNGANLTTGGAALIKANRAKIIDDVRELRAADLRGLEDEAAGLAARGRLHPVHRPPRQASPLTYRGARPAGRRHHLRDQERNMPNAVVAINHSTWNSDQVTNGFWSAMQRGRLRPGLDDRRRQQRRLHRDRRRRRATTTPHRDLRVRPQAHGQERSSSTPASARRR